MEAFFSFLAEGFEAMGYLVFDGVMLVVNTVLAGLAAAVNAVFALLPHFPSTIGLHAGEWIGWMNWWFPVSVVVGTFAACLVTFLLWFVVRILLNWAKAS